MVKLHLAAVLAAAGLAATSASAATWTFTGTTDAIAGRVDELAQGAPVYFQFSSPAPMADYIIRIYAREWITFEGRDTGYRNYNHYATVPIEAWGLKGKLITPRDHGSPELMFTYEPIWFDFAVFPERGDDGSSPWTFTVSTDPIAPPPGVPEPSMWMLMIGGFGLIGASLRRRRLSIA